MTNTSTTSRGNIGPSEFDRDSKLDQLGNGRFGVVVPHRWSTGPGANGGFVAGLLARAALHNTKPGHDLRTLTVNYLRPSTPGPAEIDLNTIHAGRTLHLVDITLHREGKPLAIARATLATRREAVHQFLDRQSPDFPPPESLEPVDWYDDPNYLRARFDTRFVVGGRPPIELDRCESSSWLRTVDHAPVTNPLLVAMTDTSLPPPVMRPPHLGTSTLNLTVHVFEPIDDPIDDFLAVTNHSTVARDGYIDTDTEVWTRDGRLLAQGRQLSIAVPWVGAVTESPDSATAGSPTAEN